MTYSRRGARKTLTLGQGNNSNSHEAVKAARNSKTKLNAFTFFISLASAKIINKSNI